MSRPQPQPRQTPGSTPISGGVDLSALKARAESAARQQQPSSAASAPADGAASRWVLDVTEQTFQADVVDRSMQVPVVVDLWATWCGPCKQLSPVLEQLAEQGRGTWVLAKVDVDVNPRIAQVFAVQSIPTVVAIVGGQPVEAFAGVQPEPQLRQWIAAIVDAAREQLPGIRAAEQGEAAAGPEPEPEDPRFTAAEQALEAGDYVTAEAAYQQILDNEPANEDAKAALSQVRFLARAEAVDAGAPARADAAPDDLDAQFAAADAEIAGQQAEQAFERLVSAVRRTGGADRERVRVHLLELFELFPTDDARVAAARRSLARALY